VDRLIGVFPWAARLGHRFAAAWETGYLRWYVITVAGGAVLLLAALLVLG